MNHLAAGALAFLCGTIGYLAVYLPGAALINFLRKRRYK